MVPVLTEAAKQVVKPVYDKFLEPQLEKIKGWFKEKNILDQADRFEEKCLDYVNQTYYKCNVVNTLVFPNEQIKIEDLYQPLRLISTTSGHTEVNKATIFTVDNTNLDFLKTYRKVLVRDQAGMGKSTLMKWIVCKTILNNLGVPVFIELRKLSASHKIIDEITAQFNQIGKPFNKDLLLTLIGLGQFIIILDGYDEIIPSEQGKVVDDIVEFSSKARNNYFIMTSRPESSLSTFGDFKVFNIAGLRRVDSIAIINKCENISGFGIAQELISDLDKKRSQVQAFLKNPFLVTLLYKVYAYNKNIPLKKSAFYEEIYQALYKHHDLSKDRFERPKKSGLDIYQFRQVLRRFAFDTAKEGVVEYTAAQLAHYIDRTRKNLVGFPDFSNEAFIEDITHHVPLFAKDGLYIKWIHKSLQDYFAGEYIVFNSNKEAILKNIYSSGKYFKYENILDFVSEIDYPVFRNTITYNAVSDFIKYYDENINDFSKYSKMEASIRVAMTFGAECYLADDLGDDALNDKLDAMIKDEVILDYEYGYVGDLCLAVSYIDVARLVTNFIYDTSKEDIFIDDFSDYFVDTDVDKCAAELCSKIEGRVIHIKKESKQFYNYKYMFVNINKLYVRLFVYETGIISYDKCRVVKEDIERRKVGGSDNDDLNGL